MRIAGQIGRNLRGSEVIDLISDLGGGKTAFVTGLVAGTGSRDNVASPTFTINRQYQSPKFTVQHFDFYRLNEAGIVADELSEFLHTADNVVVVEWGEIVHDVLPEDRLIIEITQTGDESRNFKFIYPEKYEYLLQGINAAGETAQ